MKTKKLSTRYLNYRTLKKELFAGVSLTLVPIYCLSICWQSLAQIPNTIKIAEPAKITPSMRVLTDRGAGNEPAEIDRELRKNKDALSVSGSGFARLRFFSPGEYMNTYVDAEALNGTTIYSFPCKLGHNKGSKAIITWEVKGTTKRACESGIRVTSSDSGNSRISYHNFQPFTVVAQKHIRLPIQQASDPVRRNKELSIALTSDNIRYYCSALSDTGQRGIGFGETSIEESCDNAMNKCRESSNGSDCALITIGEWSANDPELLMMSLTCGGAKPSSKKVSSSNVNINTLTELFRNKLPGLLGMNPEACFLDVYHPDEIIISPVDSQKTIVQSTDIGGGRVQVKVIDGQVWLRSTNQPEGVKANKGDIYTFDGKGVISKDRRSPTPKPPSPFSVPFPPTSSPPRSPQ